MRVHQEIVFKVFKHVIIRSIPFFFFFLFFCIFLGQERVGRVALILAKRALVFAEISELLASTFYYWFFSLFF